MNKPLSNAEMEALVTPIPMTKYEKLMRLAQIARTTKSAFAIFHRLEYQSEVDLSHTTHPNSIFGAAAKDVVLTEAGLPKTGDVLSAMKFFELDKDELHMFSCDCGGSISNADMANRIEKLASRSVTGAKPGFVARMFGA